MRPGPKQSVHNMKKTLTLLSALALLASGALAADEAGFTPLFNGKDTAGWKLRNPNGNNCWKVDEGILKNTIAKGTHGVDLLTEQKFWNFTVRFEFMVPDGSNSGFYLRGRHEIQVLGDFKSGQKSKSNRTKGSVTSMGLAMRPSAKKSNATQ